MAFGVARGDSGRFVGVVSKACNSYVKLVAYRCIRLNVGRYVEALVFFKGYTIRKVDSYDIVSNSTGCTYKRSTALSVTYEVVVS